MEMAQKVRVCAHARACVSWIKVHKEQRERYPTQQTRRARRLVATRPQGVCSPRIPQHRFPSEDDLPFVYACVGV